MGQDLEGQWRGGEGAVKRCWRQCDGCGVEGEQEGGGVGGGLGAVFMCLLWVEHAEKSFATT